MILVRERYFVCYDVRDPERLMHTHRVMKGYGEPVQYSVFMCDLNDGEIIMMKQDVCEQLNLSEDRLLVINTGSVEKSDSRVEVMGQSIEMQREAAIVV